MKYRPTYGDKQREEQKRRRNEQLRNRRVESANKQKPDELSHPEGPDKKDTNAA